jgi:hypothetical protein
LPHLLTRLVLPFILVFTALTLAARTYGAAQMRDPVLAGFIERCDGRPQPCWYGIVPGETSMQEVRSIMEQYSQVREIRPVTFGIAYQFSNTDHVFFDSLYNTTVYHMVLKLDNHISVGEVLSTIGMPDHILFRRTQSPIMYTFDFEKAQLLIIVLEPPLDMLSPHQNVSMLLDINSLTSPFPGTSYRWRGFAPHWKYCQMEPRLALC